jgi:Nucleotidyl transferase AbiEii toxin, Type IV TA system
LDKTVRPWVADDFPAAFPDWQCQVTALELARTFWEKATILHAERHCPADQVTPDRYARHYADMERLFRHPDGAVMLADHALCQRVVEWKSRVFARQWARYDLAKPGTFRLLPTDGLLPLPATMRRCAPCSLQHHLNSRS